MEIFRNNKQISNINIDNNIKGIETAKTYKYCIKCGRDLPEGSTSPWCDFSCRSSYYAEIAKEEIACFREWVGRC